MKHTHKIPSKLPNCNYHRFEVQLVAGKINIFITVNNYLLSSTQLAFFFSPRLNLFK